MVRCRFLDGAMQIPRCANFRNGKTTWESKSTFGKIQWYRLNMWAVNLFTELHDTYIIYQSNKSVPSRFISSNWSNRELKMARGRKFGKDGLFSTLPNKMSNCALKVLKPKLLLLMAFGRELNSLGALTAKERSTAVFTLFVYFGNWLTDRYHKLIYLKFGFCS